GHTGGGGQADQQKGRGLFARGLGQPLGSAPLQRHDQGRGPGGAQPDEQDVQGPVGDAVGRVVGADRRLVHEGGQQEPVGRRQDQGEGQAHGDRIAEGGVGAQSLGLDPAAPGLAPLARQDEGQGQKGGQAQAQQGRGPARPGQGETDPDQQTHDGHGDVQGGGAPHLSGRPEPFLAQLDQTARRRAVKARSQGPAEQGIDGNDQQDRRDRDQI